MIFFFVWMFRNFFRPGAVFEQTNPYGSYSYNLIAKIQKPPPPLFSAHVWDSKRPLLRSTTVDRLFQTQPQNSLEHDKKGLTSELFWCYIYVSDGDRGSAVVKALCYKSEGRWFDSR